MSLAATIGGKLRGSRDKALIPVGGRNQSHLSIFFQMLLTGVLTSLRRLFATLSVIAMLRQLRLVGSISALRVVAEPW